MKFSSLSESDIPHIEEVLTRNKITFNTTIDNDVERANDQSIHNDLRHFNGATLSSDILCIEVDESELKKLSESDKKILEEHNIFLDVEVPDFDEQITDEPDRSPDKLIVEQNRKLLGRYTQIEVILFILFLAVIGFLTLLYK